MIRYIFVLLIFCCPCRGTAQSVIGKDTLDYSLKISKINDVKSFYIIYAQRNDSTFKIVSKRQDCQSTSCEKIEVGKSYLLNLRVIFPLDSIFDFKVMNPLDISEMVIEKGVGIRIGESSHNKIYESENLQGLCYNSAFFELERQKLLSKAFELKLPIPFHIQKENYEEGIFYLYSFVDSAYIIVFQGALMRFPEDEYEPEKIIVKDERKIFWGQLNNKFWRKDVVGGIRMYYGNVPANNKEIYDKVLDEIKISPL